MDGIGEGSSGYGGDHALERLLNEAGLNQTIAEIRALIGKMHIATEDHRLTPEQRARAELSLRQLRAIQRYERRQSAGQSSNK